MVAVCACLNRLRASADPIQLQGRGIESQFAAHQAQSAYRALCITLGMRMVSTRIGRILLLSWLLAVAGVAHALDPSLKLSQYRSEEHTSELQSP